METVVKYFPYYVFFKFCETEVIIFFILYIFIIKEVMDKKRTNSPSEEELRKKQIADKKRQDKIKRKSDAKAEKERLRSEALEQQKEQKRLEELAKLNKKKVQEEKKRVREQKKDEKEKKQALVKEKAEKEARKQRKLDEWIFHIPHWGVDSAWSDSGASDDESVVNDISSGDDSYNDCSYVNRDVLKKTKAQIHRESMARIEIDSTDEELLLDDPDVFEIPPMFNEERERVVREALFPEAQCKSLFNIHIDIKNR